VAPPTPNPALTPATAETHGPSASPAASTPAQPAPVVATPEPAKPAAVNLSAADQAVADKLRDLLTTKSTKYYDRKKERDAVETFYRDRAYAPLWTENGQANSRAAAAFAYLKGVDTDGLDPTEYATPELKGDADAVADAELKLTNAVLTYVRHASTGRVSFTRISNDIYYDLEFPEPTVVLAKLAINNDPNALLDSYEPQHEAYKALKAKYAEARGKTGDMGPARIPNGAQLKLGKDTVKDPRVPLLRERLRIVENPNDTTYDKTVADAVSKYQAEKKLAATGVLNQATIDAINGPKRGKNAEVILANLERWRWIPHDLRGDRYVMVNIPDYTLKIVSGGKEYWKTRIVVGKPGMSTPMISPDMKFITVNPTWNVPPSIIANEYLPALRQDPSALSRIGLRIEQNPDGTVRIYQPPGEANALGRIRFNFPNKFLVYQHDTPDKHLFAQEMRAFSHGCMRVQNPFTYAEKLLALELPSQGYSEDKIKKMLGSSEINIDFPKPLPVHLTYQTAFVDESGTLQFREDIYGRDARILQALKTEERKVADVAVEQHSVGSASVGRDALRYQVDDGGFENPFVRFFQFQPLPPQREDPRNRGRRNTRETGFFGLFR
jgi:murein L,D-transpeptidase YcbB/YkuD